MEFNFKDSGEYLLCFQFLGIPPKGEPPSTTPKSGNGELAVLCLFPISRDPPEGGTLKLTQFEKPSDSVSNF